MLTPSKTAASCIYIVNPQNHSFPLAPCRRAVAPSSGFSLIEVVLAISIVAFGFIAIFGLLPIGMGLFKTALQTSVHTQIVQRIITDAEQTDFDTLVSQGIPTRYFDDEGNEFEATDPRVSQSLYTAFVTVKPLPTPLPKAASSSNLLTLVIKLGVDPNHSAQPGDFDKVPPKFHIWTDIAYVARNQTQTQAK